MGVKFKFTYQYNFQNFAGYIFDATMGRKLVDTLKVIRKIMRRQIPKTLRKTVEDEIVHSQRERVSGLLIKVLSKANGLLVNFEVLHKRGKPGGLLGMHLSPLSFI